MFNFDTITGKTPTQAKLGRKIPAMQCNKKTKSQKYAAIVIVNRQTLVTLTKRLGVSHSPFQ